MKLLILTQKMAQNDPILGFFHRWVEELAKHYESLTVICLEKGKYDLPGNVQVVSLGKELGISKLKKLFTFYHLLFTLRKQYDAVFVHMNQEYVILGWKFWKLWGKKIYLWRNHAHGSFLTRFAVLVSDKVFCTSPDSYTARFKKTKLMPVGIDTDFFKPDSAIKKEPNSILFLGRIAPVKKVLEFVEWFNTLDGKFQATLAGEALPKDKWYEKLVKAQAPERIKFISAVTQEEACRLYQSHETYVNFTPAGSMDKTILEAAACGAKVKVENPALKFLEGKASEELRNFVVENHSLKKLILELSQQIQ
ncbi:MAG: glycosyltransferase [Patescibacteria group bacterium]